MKKLFSLLLLSSLFLSLSAQSLYKVTINVSAATGDNVQGLKVKMENEEYGLQYPDATINASGVATFTNVVEGTNTLTIDGSKLGLETYVDRNFVVSSDITATIVLKEATSTPFNIQYTAAHDAFTGKNKVTLTWNKEEAAFEDDFEGYDPFAISFAPWTGIDGDKEPAATLQGEYQNAGLPQYATIFNLMGLGDGFWYDYPVLRPYSGKQCAGFVRTASGNANNDWLITPKVKIGRDFIVRFYAKGSERVKDRFNVLVSTKSNNKQSDFVSLTPGNYQTVGYEYWNYISYSLKQYEGQEVYIAIQCVSQNSFMLMVDDFFVGPDPLKVNKTNPNETFSIILDGTEAATSNVPSYTFADMPNGKHTIGIRANYRTSQSEIVTTELDLPSADSYASLNVAVNTNNGHTPEQILYSITNAETGLQIDSITSATAFNVPFLLKGKYHVNVSAEGYQNADADVDLTTSQPYDLTTLLKELLAAPFGLTADNVTADGKTNVILKWNQTLGFTDGFETYDDFSQSFAPWTVLDIDAMPTYAMSIGGTNITYPEPRAKVGAMVFNPEKTKPIKASEDGLFTAPEGTKYVMFSSAEQGKSDDWLIAPPITIYKDYVFRFTGKSYASSYPGTFEIGALSDNDRSTFKKVAGITFNEEWNRFEVDLSEFAGSTAQVAMHHISHDMWISMVDDVYIGPREEQAAGSASSLCTFEIYVDGNKYAETDKNIFTLDSLAPGTHTIGVKAIYASGESEMTEITVTVGETTGIYSLTTSQPHALTTSVYNLNGQKVGRNYRGIVIKNGKAMMQ